MTECAWIDGFGRKVQLRQRAFEEVLKHLENLSEEVLTEDSIELQSPIDSNNQQEGLSYSHLLQHYPAFVNLVSLSPHAHVQSV